VQRYYFDHNATTPVLPEVLAAMAPVLTEVYGNPSSIHYYGQRARQLLDDARRVLAQFMGATPEEIVPTSGGTEGDNLAISGVARGGHAITTTVEHSAVHGAGAQLAGLTRVPVDSRGIVDAEDIRRALRPDTKLISVMHVNNELGSIQPLAEISKIAREAGVLFHSDGVQAAGKIKIDVEALGVDLYTISGHKFYAPKGAGALFVRKGVEVRPLQYGGHHERDRRAGTENVAGAVALARAAQILLETGEQESARVSALRDQLERAILARIEGTHVNGAGAPRTPNVTNIRFDGIDSEPLMIALDLRGFAVSSGSACLSGASEPSHVLTAIGLTKEQGRSSVRFSLGRSNDQAQVDALTEALVESVAALRRVAPVYA
jgi:cysteine desulfurase